MQNLILILFTVAVFLTFTIFVSKKYGVQRSISASIHVLSGAWEKSTYSWFILGIAIPMMIVSNTSLGVWAGIFLAIDAAAVTTNDDNIQLFLHCMGADVGMMLGLALLITFGMLWLFVVATIVCGLILFLEVKNSTWWIESTVFATVMTGLLIEKVL